MESPIVADREEVKKCPRDTETFYLLVDVRREYCYHFNPRLVELEKLSGVETNPHIQVRWVTFLRVAGSSSKYPGL